MSKRFHIIVTGESGRSLSLQISKKKLYISTLLLGFGIVALGLFSYQTTGSYFSNKLLKHKVAGLQAQLERSLENEKHYLGRIDNLKRTHDEDLAALQHQHEAAQAEQKMLFDLENTTLQLENVRLMATAVNDLNQRSRLIESIMGTIGVEINKSETAADLQNTGGPYIPAEESGYEDLLKQVDSYLTTIRTMPLGKPVDGSISSGFGKRNDPLNSKKSFHEGVDIRGKQGDRVYATAGGKVLRAFKNGSYGNYVEIDHGNGYVTVYAHLQNYLVRAGETVQQGQVIGQLGNSGRSTGPHLHYEVRLGKKPVDPKKFMQVADLNHTLTATLRSE